MKNILKLIAALSVALPLTANAFSVERIDPPHWWTGMKNTSLQLQIHGQDIKNTTFSVDYPGITVDSVVRLDGSDNWQFVYLNVSPDTKPGTMVLTWRDGKKIIKQNYEIRARRAQKGAQGFTAADVLYLIMPDRFSDGNPDNNIVESLTYKAQVDRTNPNVRHGGDFAGIMNHIDYIDSLGVTAVWVNPVLENDMRGGSYHGYSTTDYYRVDPRFGSNAEYAALIDTLHGRGIKTVMDMIFNHTGVSHPWIDDRPASDWLNFPDRYRQTNYRLSTISDPYTADYDRTLAVDGWFVGSMPDLNQRNTHLMRYLVQNSIWWIEEAQIDGIRMDTYPYADRAAMAGWIDNVMAEYPNFNIVGECWYTDPASISTWQTGSPLAMVNGDDPRLRTVMDFPLMILAENLEPFTSKTDGNIGLGKMYNHFALDFVYADPLHVLRFLDNHDTDRVIKEDVDTLNSWKQAITLLLTAPGIPQLYYGTEILMSGTRKGGDGMIRQDMPGGFPGDTVNQFYRSGRTDLMNEAYDYIADINRWRKSSKAVAEGTMRHFVPDNGLYLYQRQAEDDAFIVVMNGRDEQLEVDMSRYAEVVPVGTRYRDALTGEIVLLRNDATSIYTFAPRETRILIPIR